MAEIATIEHLEDVVRHALALADALHLATPAIYLDRALVEIEAVSGADTRTNASAVP